MVAHPPSPPVQGVPDFSPWVRLGSPADLIVRFGVPRPAAETTTSTSLEADASLAWWNAQTERLAAAFAPPAPWSMLHRKQRFDLPPYSSLPWVRHVR